MEPELFDGDRLLVDTSKQVPETGELFVLWYGNGIVVKRVESVTGAGEPGLRMTSTNADYGDYIAPAGDIYIVGKVLWLVRKV